MINSYDNVKCPGVADIFRIPKLGASFYQAQIYPNIRPVIAPNFYWDFGPQTPNGPGKNAAIFSNCAELKLFIDGKFYKTLHPDAKNFPHIPYPPFFVDLDMDGAGHPELHINGFIDERLVLSKTMSSDASKDQFVVNADDVKIIGDGSDATRLVFQVVDQYGSIRLYAGGEVAWKVQGPGEIIGDNPFQLNPTGGVGAIWIRALPGSSGEIVVDASHSTLGTKSLVIAIQPNAPLMKI